MKVLVTGASGGIGEAVVNYLTGKNIEVIACDLVKKQFDSPLVSFYELDVCNQASIDNLRLNLENKRITLDAIVNIAGMFLIDSFIEVNNEQLKRLFDVNLMGVIAVNKTLFPLLNKNGRIVITTSDVATLDPMPFNGIYNVSKTALDSYSQALRQELNLLGIKVITIRPGAFNTTLSQGSLTKTKELSDKTVLYKKQSKRFYSLVKGFMGKPKDPKKLAPTYYKALTKKRPKLCYRKNANILLALLNVLPKRLQCFIIKLILK